MIRRTATTTSTQTIRGAWIALACAALGSCGGESLSAADPQAEVEFFETRIRPTLVKYCYECHSAASVEIKGGLRLDSREGARRGGESGPAVVPGRVDKSLLIDAVRHESLKMPPDKKLPDAVVADLVRWIEHGATDPRDRPPTTEEAAELSWQAIFEERRGWWSLQPLAATTPPKVADAAWNKSSIDQFIRAKLDAEKIEPASEAELSVLLRRLSFVLTGLPPTAELLSARDYEAAVDTLLASPHFGERFARHWMDVVRYGDTYGYEWDNPARGSWRYRDYLIRAFNADVGFDQLVKEQLAGDLLERPRVDAASGLNESLIGPMFYHLGEHRHGDSLDFNGVHQEMINNKIDAFSKAFLATTVACARCHDHKLDAVAQKDYFALASVFMTPRWTARCIDLPERNGAAIAHLQSLREEIRATLVTQWKQAAAKLPERLNDVLKQLPTDPKKKPSLEDIAYPLVQIAAMESDEEVALRWEEMATEWRKAHAARTKDNRKKYQTLADFRREGLPAGWTAEGDGMRYGYVADGMPLVALDGEAVVARLLPRGYHTYALSPKLPGSLRSPRLQTLGAPNVSVALAGDEWSGHLTIVENAFQTERNTFLNQPKTAWQKFATFQDKPDWNVRIEIATSDLNPCFPPRWGKTKAGNVTLPQRDLGDGKLSWFSVTQITTHADGAAPVDTLDRFESLYGGEPPRTKDEAIERIADWFAAAVNRWVEGRSDDGDVERLNWLLEQKLLPNQTTDDAKLARLVKEYRRVESTIAPPRTVNGMDERETSPIAYRLNIRGNVDELGDPVPHDFLRVFAGRNEVAQSHGSGRRELAEFLVRGDHPLTARVYVNRVWSWVFGEGLVRTPDDFGHLGRLPTHPELLDYLAREFAADGWSTKRLIRRMLLSRTFRQSGQASEQARTVDPENHGWHHLPTRRLEAEAVRDAILAVSGRLDPTPFGPPIDPPRAKEDDMKRLFSGPIDGAGRRSIYLRMTIMEPPKFLAAFNQPSPKIPTGRRDTSNVPAQALALLNDPFVAEQAVQWGKSLVDEQHKTIRERLSAMFVRALGRQPTGDEVALWTAALDDFASDGVDDDAALLKDTAAWTRAAHALFNSKEFLYVR